MTVYGNDLINTSQFLNGEKLFATYASAQEVVEDIFQPSGIDYIIHTLGDQQRVEYLHSFVSGDFKFAATIKEEATFWGYWVQRGNWFFYRELYKAWHPVYANSYEMYWERNENVNHTLSEACSVEVQEVDSATKKIVVRADTGVNGVADVYIDYKVQKNGQTNYLRPEGA